MKYIFNVTRRTKKDAPAMNYATGDVHRSRGKTQFWFFSSWDRKVDSGGLKTHSIHVFGPNREGVLVYADGVYVHLQSGDRAECAEDLLKRIIES